MGITFNATPSASAPQFEEGMTDAWFLGAELKEHPDWAGDGKFGHDDGRRFHFNFLVADAETPGEPVYDEGEPLTVEKLSNTNMNITSKTVPAGVKVLKALMTPTEFVAWQTDPENNSPKEEDLIGRPCQLMLSRKDNGWPNVDDVLAGRKGFKARKATA